MWKYVLTLCFLIACGVNWDDFCEHYGDICKGETPEPDPSPDQPPPDTTNDIIGPFEKYPTDIYEIDLVLEPTDRIGGIALCHVNHDGLFDLFIEQKHTYLS